MRFSAETEVEAWLVRPYPKTYVRYNAKLKRCPWQTSNPSTTGLLNSG
jgi:hypothetical protein